MTSLLYGDFLKALNGFDYSINGKRYKYGDWLDACSKEGNTEVASFSYKLDGNTIELNLSFKNSTQCVIVLQNSAHEFLRCFILNLISITNFIKPKDLEKILTNMHPYKENGYRRYEIFDDPMKLEFDGRVVTVELTTIFAVKSWKIRLN